MNLQESQALWANHRAQHAMKGVVLPGVRGYAFDEVKPAIAEIYDMAMDAQVASTTSANAALPALFTSYVDPEVIRVAFAPSEAANIIGEEKRGDWTTDTLMFIMVESTGETSSYDDFSENGSAGVNTNFPQRQPYHFQVMKEYGERQLERAGLAKINYVTEVDLAATESLARFSNLSYFYGIKGLQNYGILNDPALSASLTPGTKAGGNGNKWVANGFINASANEVLADVQALFGKLVAQTNGLVKLTDRVKLCMSPSAQLALTATNIYGKTAMEMIKAVFPNLTVETAVQYGAKSALNPQGMAAGEMLQMIAETVDGKKTAFASFTEKLRAHKLIPATSSYKQKLTSGTNGAIIRMPMGIASMIGI